MPTVSEHIAVRIKNNDGYYNDDPRAVRIIEYTDMGGKQAYGVEYPGQEGKYHESEYVQNPTVYWEASDAR